MVALRPEHWRAFSYVMLNMVSATGIVFANKLVLSVLDFHYVRPCPSALSCAACMHAWNSGPQSPSARLIRLLEQTQLHRWSGLG